MMQRSSLASRTILLVLLAAAAASASAQQVTLGRLFATADERSAMDRQRDAGGAAPMAQPQAMPGATGAAPMAQPPGMPDPNAPPPGMQPPGAAAAPPPSSAVQLSGVLRGSSGRTTVWLNQVPQENGAQAIPGQGVALRLSSGRKLIMKPGQSFDPANGNVQELGR
ncbi:hypothetical protein [Rugamonas aquatica]|uniref:Uncharacterized protein n=1 Tax=Rugamonas aquatica TaxID=2743357 RepID=A0A6A7NCP6_9BURK|nr:hypothetical protein [Rugamonas aquatica]MQA42804.1 hypothetical protein [Rugamonas aquatica]